MVPRQPRHRRARLLSALALALAIAPGLGAHPHMWIDATIDLELGSSGLTGIRVGWLFDEFSSADLLHRYRIRGATVSAAQSRLLYEGAFRHLIDIGYFLVVSVDGRKQTIGEATAFRASLREDRLLYEFSVPLEVGWGDIGRLMLTLFDESFYVSFELAPGSGRYQGGGRAVTVSVVPVPLATIGWGQITVSALRVAVR